MHSSWLSIASSLFFLNFCLFDVKAEGRTRTEYEINNSNIMINSKNNNGYKNVKDYESHLREVVQDEGNGHTGRDLPKKQLPSTRTSSRVLQPNTAFNSTLPPNLHNLTAPLENMTDSQIDALNAFVNQTSNGNLSDTLGNIQNMGDSPNIQDLANQIGDTGNIDVNAFLNDAQNMDDILAQLGGKFNMSLGDSSNGNLAFDPNKLSSLINGAGGGALPDFGGIGTNMNFSSNQPWKICCSVYDPPQKVINVHGISRFGHTDDLDQVIITGEYEDYVTGLIAVPIVLAFFFGTWQFLIIVMKCCSCGFLSGKNLVVDAHGEGQKKVYIITLVFLLSCIGLLLSLSTFKKEGVGLMDESLSILYWATHNLKNISTVNAHYMHNISTESAYAQSSFQTKSMADMLGSLCPDRLDIRMKATEFNILMGIWSEAVSGGGVDMIQKAGASLEQLSDVVDKAEGRVAVFEESLEYIEAVYYTPLLVLTALLTLSCLTARCCCSIAIWDFFISYIILPIFQLFITCSWVLSLVLLIFAMVNSDLCYGGDQHSPEGTIQSFFERQGISPDSTDQTSELAYSTAMYYIGCNASFPFDVVGTLAGFTNATAKPGQVLIDTISDQLSDSRRYLQGEVQAASTLVEGSCVTEEAFQDIQTIVLVLKILMKLMTDLVKYVSCDFVGPVYDQLVNTALCTYSPVSLAMASSSLMIASACGLMMVTLRSALLPQE